MEKSSKITWHWLNEKDEREFYCLLGFAKGSVDDYEVEDDFESYECVGKMHSLRIFIFLVKLEITWFT